MTEEYIIEQIEYFDEVSGTEILLNDVVIEVNYDIENDSFDHEFGTESFPDHVEITGCDWEENKYTQLEEDAINYWLDNNYDVVAESIDIEPDFDY